MTILADMTQDAMLARIAELEAKLSASKRAQGKLTIKVSAKGAISIYGFGQWPVTLYRSQMERLIDAVPQIKAFIETNADQLATKS